MPLKSGQLEIVVVIVRRAPEFFVLPLLTRLGLVLCAHSDMACASKRLSIRFVGTVTAAATALKKWSTVADSAQGRTHPRPLGLKSWL
jgi:uncharacterized membrane protein